MKGSSARPEQVAETLRQVIADALTGATCAIPGSASSRSPACW